MTWKTIIGEVKRVRKGERVGYDLTERLTRDTVVAVLPIGYWHGYDRGLSSIGEVLVRGRRAKVLGRVSMDMTAVDVTGNPGVRIGDEVVLIGRQGREFIGADEMAGKISTTAYEILTRVNPLIRRTRFKQKKCGMGPFGLPASWSDVAACRRRSPFPHQGDLR